MPIVYWIFRRDPSMEIAVLILVVGHIEVVIPFICWIVRWTRPLCEFVGTSPSREHVVRVWPRAVRCVQAGTAVERMDGVLGETYPLKPR